MTESLTTILERLAALTPGRMTRPPDGSRQWHVWLHNGFEACWQPVGPRNEHPNSVHDFDLVRLQMFCQQEADFRDWEWRVGQTYMGYNAEVWPTPTRDGYYGEADDSAAEALAAALLAALEAL